LEVVEAGLGIVHISAVAQGIESAESRSHHTGGGKRFTPGIVGITNHDVTGAVHDAHHITLQIYKVIVIRAVEVHRHRCSAGIVGIFLARVAVGGRLIPPTGFCFNQDPRWYPIQLMRFSLTNCQIIIAVTTERNKRMIINNATEFVN